jgi:glycerol uptake facilitator-like aquaporin
MGNPSNLIKLFYEFSGTFILSAAINLSTTYLPDGTQIANLLLIITSFFVAITISRAITGGHINPAVTTAVFIEKPSDVRGVHTGIFSLYMLAQILGAFSACFYSYFIYGNVFKLAPAATASSLSAFHIEVLATTLFVYTILAQGNQSAKLTKDNSLSTLIVSLALFGCIGIAGNISGACLNPAIGIAHNLTRYILTGDLSEIQYLWVYIAGPLLGGIFAGLLYNGFFKKYFIDRKIKA